MPTRMHWFAALVLLNAAAVNAQNFPAKPVRVIVPFPAGGGLDITARAFGQKLAEYWGQTVVIDNRPGASGMIGAETVRSEEHTSELQSRGHLVCRLLLE